MFSLIKLKVVRAGLEPATHGFSVRKRPNEIVDGIDGGKNRGRNPGQLSEAALNDLIERWGQLSIATQNRIHQLALAEAPDVALAASSKRGGK